MKTMTFEEWTAYKQSQAKTHRDTVTEFDRLKSLFYTVDDICFNGMAKTQGVKPWYITPNIERDSLLGTFIPGDKSVMISKSYYEEHGIDRDVIRLVFHELIHVYCDFKGIKDVVGKEHLQAFADACKERGGYALWENEVRGYNDVHLTEDSYNRIETELRGWRS